MTEYKTPGVYVKEISKFPPSVAGVATAIPAFIGFTEKPTFDKNKNPQVVKIKSLLEYENLFGGGPKLELNNNGELQNHTFVMYDSIRLFYDNGGGTCYVVSIGDYKSTDFDADQYKNGLEPLKKVDEVTLLVTPDAAMLLDEAQLGTLHQAMLEQCAVLGDRFAILDPKPNNSLDNALKTFRKRVGNNNLAYGAAYYPYLKTTYTKDISFDEMLKIADIKEKAQLISLYNNFYAKPNNELATEAWGEKNILLEDENRKKFSTLNGVLLYNSAPITPEGFFKDKETDLDVYNKVHQLMDQNKQMREGTLFTIKGGKLMYDGNEITESTVLSDKDASIKDALQDLLNQVKETIKDTAFTINKGILQYGGKALPTFVVDKVDETVYQAILSEINLEQQEIEGKKPLMAKALAAQINGYAEKLAELQDEASIITPSGAIAGIYAATDGSKGVWQAPANVSIAAIADVTELISDKDQENMNVDATAGKSVNAIRFFTGKGILVWGARTLDGNSNEWRYISVRRLFNYVEESVQKSTNWAVFQPNDANTWVKIQCQIENFLNNLWRDGALAGPTPDKAYYVKVGQDVTMTADDINNGYLIVEIGIAAVRPAEFIVLKFSHKVQEA